MSRGEEKRARIAAVVDAILDSGTAVPAVVDMIAAILRERKFGHEAALLESAVSIMMGGPSDADQIIAWCEGQAAKEKALLDTSLRPSAKVTTQERWLVYKASAQAVRDGVWMKLPADGITRKPVDLPRDPNNHRAPARDADGEPGNESE